MKKRLLTIGFALGGIFTSFAQAHSIPSTIVLTLASVDISNGGAGTRTAPIR